MRSAQTLHLIVVLMLLIPASSWATTHRVNNTPEAGVGTVTTLTAAIAAASNVVIDTILVESSDITYDVGGVTVDKTVRIFGTGYFLADNPCTQADTRAATFDDITFVAGSEGSAIAGITAQTVTVEASQVRVLRCRIQEYLGVGTTTAVSNVMLFQNFLKGGSDSLVSIVNCTNYIFRNNVVFTTTDNAPFLMKVHSGSGLVLNNIFRGFSDSLIIKNATIQNNQFGDSARMTTFSSTNVTVEYNIAEQEWPIDFDPGLVTNYVSLEDSLGGLAASVDSLNCHSVMFGVSRDAIYEINSLWTDVSHPGNPNPAYNTGADGRHVGSAGGTDPYVLSGMPPIPSVAGYTGSASGTTGSGTTATVKGKSRR